MSAFPKPQARDISRRVVKTSPETSRKCLGCIPFLSITARAWKQNTYFPLRNCNGISRSEDQVVCVSTSALLVLFVSFLSCFTVANAFAKVVTGVFVSEFSFLPVCGGTVGFTSFSFNSFALVYTSKEWKNLKAYNMRRFPRKKCSKKALS